MDADIQRPTDDLPPDPAVNLRKVFPGDGEAVSRLREINWSRCEVGPPSQWPQSLKTLVRFVLSSREPMWLAWGSQLTFFCNDACLALIGLEHDWLSCTNWRMACGEVWPHIGQRIDQVMKSGEAARDEAVLVFTQRDGYPVETYHGFSYSPVTGDDDHIHGCLCIVSDDSDKVIGDRRLALLRMLTSRLAGAASADEIFSTVRNCIETQSHDLPFTLTYLFDADAQHARLVCRTGIASNDALAARDLLLDTSPWPLREVMDGLLPVQVDDIGAHVDATSFNRDHSPPSHALVLPMIHPAQARPFGAFVAGLNPYRPLDGAYIDFITLCVAQISAALAHTSRPDMGERGTAAMPVLRQQADEAQRILQGLLDHVPEGITMTGGPPDFPIIAISRMMLALLGKDGDHTLGLPVDEHIAAFGLHLADGVTVPTQRQLPLYRATHHGEVVNDEEWVMRRDDGERIIVLASAAPIRDRTGAIIGAINCWRDITARKRAEEALHASERNFRAMFEVSSVGMAQADPHTTRLLQVNDTFSRMLGYLPEELIGKTVADITYPEDRDLNTAKLQALLRGEIHEFTLEKRLLNKVGEPVWVHLNVTLLRDEKGRPLRTAAVIIDISERKRVEQGLREREAMITAITDSVRALIAVFDGATGKCVYANAYLEQLLGYTPQEFYALSRDDLIALAHPDDILLFTALMSACHRARGGERLALEVRARHKDGDYRWLQAEGTPFGPHDVTCMAVLYVIVDITARKQAEEELYQSEQQMRLAMEAGKTFIWEVDVETDVVQYSPDVKEVLGFSLPPSTEEAMSLIHADDLDIVRARYEAALRGGQQLDSEFRLVDPATGRTEWARVQGRYMDLASGMQRRLLGVTQNITERKRRELNAVLLAELNKELAQLTDAGDIMRVAGEKIALHFGASRVSFAEIDEAGDDSAVRHDYVHGAGVSTIGSYRLADLMSEDCVAELRAERAVVIGDVARDPRTAPMIKVYRRSEIGAFLQIPRLSDGHWKSMLAVAHREAHAWRADEIELIRELAERIWLRLDRAAAEHALRESERRLQLALDATGLGIWIWEAHRNHILWSERLFAITGLASTGPAVDTEVAKGLIYPDDLGIVDNAEQAVIEGRPFEAEYRILRPDGTLRWVANHARADYDAEGRPWRLIGTLADITPRKQAEEALKKSEERLQSALDAARMAVWEWDSSTDTLIASATAADVFGLPPGETLHSNTRVLSLVHPKDIERHRAVVARAMENCNDFYSVYRIIRPRDGAVAWLEGYGTARCDELTGKILLAGVVRDISDRMRTEEALRQSEERFRHLSESLPIVITMDAPDGRIEYANPAWYEYTGLSADRADEWLSAVHPDDVDTVVRRWEQAAEHGGPFEIEFRRRAKDGEYRWFFATGRPVYDPEGQIIHWVNCGWDIHDRKLAEERVRESERRLSTELEAMTRLHDVSTRLFTAPDIRAALGEVLDAAVSICGAEMGNVQVYHPESGGLQIVAQRGFDEAFLAHFKSVTREDNSSCGRALRSGRRVVIEDVENDPDFAPHLDAARKAGYRTVQSTPLLSSRGEILGIISTHCREVHRPSERELRMLDLYARLAADIVARLRAEQSLRESETRFRVALESSAVPFVILSAVRDEQGRIVDFKWAYANTAAAVIIGPPAAELMGRRVTDILPGSWAEPGMFERFTGVIEHEQPQAFEVQSYEHGINGWFYMIASPLGGGIALWFADITDRKLREQLLREDDRKKDEFLATLAHELRNPLAPIRHAIHIAKSPQASDGQIRWSHEVIERQVQHMSLLLDDLLEVARITRGKLQLRKEVIDLSAVIQGVIDSTRPLIEARHHTLDVRLPTEPLRLEADPMRLAQVFSNLLTNAAKYTDVGGTIGVSAHYEGDIIVARVSDTGIGIPPEALPRIFEMFSQVQHAIDRAAGGLGIGLALSKGLVTLHGGTITAQSEGVGHGSTFTVRLPAFKSEQATEPPRASPLTAMPAAPQRHKVLVVDDNRDAAESLALLIQLDGHETRLAHDGLEALAVADAFRPDIVLLDIGLPHLNGYEVAQRLRAAHWGAHLTLIALTGWGQREDRERAIHAGFDHHLTKPVDPEVLRSMINMPAM